MSRSVTRALSGAIAGLLACSQLGCGPPIESAVPSRLTIAAKADITGFIPNPPVGNEGYTLHVNSNIFEGLVALDETKRVVPNLAKQWVSLDESTYAIDLDEGLLFSDGTPVTAEDVVASLEAAVSREWPTRGYLQAVESVSAEGDRRVIIKTKSQYHTLLTQLHRGFVLPARAVSQDTVPIVGTGPYTLVEWEPGRSLTLAANQLYRHGPTAYDDVRFLVEPNDQRRIEAVLSGEAQIADHLPLDQVARLQDRDDVQVIVRQSNRVLFLCLRLDQPPFSDPRVREAVDLAIDRELLIDRALSGLGQPASQVVAPAIHGFDSTLEVTEPDVQRARELLIEAGYGEGLEVTLTGTFNRYVNDSLVLEEIADQLAAVGIVVKVHTMDKGDFFQVIDRGSANFFLLGWVSDTGEAGNILDGIVHSKAGSIVGSHHLVGLSDPELDALIEDAAAARSIEVRTELFKQAMSRLAGIRTFIPLYVQPGAVLVSTDTVWEPQEDLGFRLTEIRPAE